MPEQKSLTEQESLRIIAEMMQKVKSDYYETGVGALLWGSVVGFCSLFTFLRIYFKWDIDIDIWLLTLFAIVPQVWISFKESKARKAKLRDDNAINTVWIIFAVTMFCLTFYQNLATTTAIDILADQHIQLMQKNTLTGEVTPIKPFVPSISSLFLMVYAMPTMITGLVRRFMPMIIGGIICYICFIVSCYTSGMYDMLLSSIAAISCWLIPGLILQRRYRKSRSGNV